MRKKYGGLYSISQQQFAICRQRWNYHGDTTDGNLKTAQEIILRRCGFRPPPPDIRLWDDWRTDTKWFRVKSYYPNEYLFETPEGAEFPRLREVSSSDPADQLPSSGIAESYPEAIHQNSSTQVAWVDTTLTMEPVITLDDDGEPHVDNADMRIVDERDDTELDRVRWGGRLGETRGR